MRHLIYYIRSAFCNHDWFREETISEVYSGDSVETGQLIKQTPKVSLTCTKCGWHRKFNKY